MKRWQLSMLARFAALAMVLPLVLILGCTSEGKPATESPTVAAEAPAAPTPAAPPPGSPRIPTLSGDILRVPSTVRLIDVRSGAARTLYEDFDAFVFLAEFDASGLVVGFRDAAGIKRAVYGLDGKELERKDWSSYGSGSDGDCKEVNGSAEVSGRRYDGVHCGFISPDNTWITYQVPMGEHELPGGYRVPVWDQWAVNLHSGERRLLQDRLLHCGGCDGRFGPAWSLTGRYLYFADLGGESRTFLSDLVAGTTRVIFAGDTQIGSEPDWSPAADLLLYRGENSSTVLEDLPAGTKQTLAGVPWPARFDSTGAYAFSPGWGGSDKTQGGVTAVFDVKTRRVVATLAGQPPYGGLYTPFVPVGALQGGGFVAALENAAGCAGTAVYAGSTLVKCVTGAGGAAVSPDGTTVALARKTGDAGRYSGPNGTGGSNAEIYEIVLVDTRSGAERVLLKDAVGIQGPVPVLWNKSGNHLLVRWPFSYGL